MSTALDARYGRTRGRRIRTRTVAIVAGAGVLLVAVAWALWVGLFGATSSIETQDVGYTVVDSHAIDIRSQVSTDPGTRVSCSIQALNEKFAIVGWKVVTLPPVAERNRVFTERVRTSEPAVSGLIGSCWTT
jgi:Domain of unknown function (DUF4307)